MNQFQEHFMKKSRKYRAEAFAATTNPERRRLHKLADTYEDIAHERVVDPHLRNVVRNVR